MAVAATEIRAFLICDVRGYTRYTVEHGDEAAARLAADFAGIVNAAVADYGGDVVELRGDEALVVFTSARQAVRAAVELQRRSAALPLGVGAGLDAGEAVPVLGGFRGQALNLAARLCSLAAPGEVLASDSLTHLSGRVEEIRFEPRGSVQLKGFTEPVDVVGIETLTAPEQTRAESAAPADDERIPIGAYLGALPAGPLVGRAPEWERLREVIDEAAGGAGRTILLAGEPGAGKTRLAQEAMLALRDRGYVIATGACLETRQSVPYFPFLDVLPRLVSAHERAGGEALARWPYVQRLVAGGAAPETDHAEEERVRRDVADFVAQLARRRPVAILVDDLHWADGSSLELVHQLARQLRTERVLIAATYRDVEVRHDHPLERVLRALRRDELATVVPVRRLSPDGTAALVAASFGEESVSSEFAELIHGQTEGNPFFVQQVLRALVERGDVYREGGSWERREVSDIEVPESIRAAVGERVARLPETSRDVVIAAAVLGQRFEFDELLELAGVDEDVLEAAVEGAVAAGLLRSEGGDRYAFDHALAQQTLLLEVPARRKRRLHAQAGAVVAKRAERDAARAAEVAYHLVEADEPEPAARWSLEAGRHAEAVVALRDAEGHFRRAADLAAEAGEAELRLEAQDRLGWLLGRLGKTEEAIATQEAVLAEKRRRGASADDQASTAAALGRVLIIANRGRDVRGVLEPLLELAGISDRARARLLVAIARGAFGTGDFQGLIRAASEARELARAAGDRELEAEAIGRLALGIGNVESRHKAAELYREAIALDADGTDLETRAVLHNNYAWTLFTLGDHAGNVENRRISAELSERYASPGPIAFGRVMVGQAELFRGNVEEARRWVDSAGAMLADTEPGWHASYVWGQQGMLAAIDGDVARAEALFRDALSAARKRGDRQLASWMTAELALLLARTGRAEEGIAEARLELEEATGWRFRALCALARCELAAGRVEEALAHARDAVADAAGSNDPEGLEARLALGMALRVVDAEAAREELTAVVERADRMPYPAVAVEGRIELADLEAKLGQETAAEKLRAEAAELAERHHFRYLRARLDRAPASPPS